MGAERVVGIDRLPERLQMAREHVGSGTTNSEEAGSGLDVIREMTGGRGPDACIDAVGMEAHGTGPRYAYGRADRPTLALVAAATPGPVQGPKRHRSGARRAPAHRRSRSLPGGRPPTQRRSLGRRKAPAFVCRGCLAISRAEPWCRVPAGGRPPSARSARPRRSRIVLPELPLHGTRLRSGPPAPRIRTWRRCG